MVKPLAVVLHRHQGVVALHGEMYLHLRAAACFQALVNASWMMRSSCLHLHHRLEDACVHFSGTINSVWRPERCANCPTYRSSHKNPSLVK